MLFCWNSNSQKTGIGQTRAARVKQMHGHPVRIVEGERREHPSSVKTAICTFCLTIVSPFLLQFVTY